MWGVGALPWVSPSVWGGPLVSTAQSRSERGFSGWSVGLLGLFLDQVASGSQSRPRSLGDSPPGPSCAFLSQGNPVQVTTEGSGWRLPGRPAVSARGSTPACLGHFVSPAPGAGPASPPPSSRRLNEARSLPQPVAPESSPFPSQGCDPGLVG